MQQRGLDLKVFADEVESELLPALIEAAVEYGYTGMMARAPVKTGRLLGSIQKQVQGLSGSVGPTVPYAWYVEHGTMPHQIRPVFSSVLAFRIGNKMVFTTLVRHPGTRPNPFVEETAEYLKEKIPELWKEVFDDAVH